ncbi:MAG: maleylpyruvate isomerase family mycothiol-dependent enzyme [Nocardioides sp.]
MSHPAALRSASQRLLRTVDLLPDADYGAPSLLPGWTRSHVVAHLALNAEALAGCLRGAAAGHEVPMYESDEARDADIVVLAGRPPSHVRDRLFASTTELAAAIDALPDEALDVVIARTPGSDRWFEAGEVAAMREGEVEIHHVDLASSFTPADWPDDFCGRLITRMAGRPQTTPFLVHASNLDRTWQCGGEDVPGPTVSGPAAALGWWLTGRGSGDGLTVDDGQLPQIEGW